MFAAPRQHHHERLREQAGVHDGVGNTGNGGQQLVHEPMLPREQRGVGPRGEPLRERDDRLELGLLRREGEGDRALNHVRLHRRTVVRTLRARRGSDQQIWIVEIADHDLSAQGGERLTAHVVFVNRGANRVIPPAELGPRPQRRSSP